MSKTPSPPNASRPWPALLLALVSIALSIGVLYLTAGVYGTIEGWYDTASYLSGAVHLLKGHGYSIKTYDIATDTLRFEPITHYPPMTSLVYAFFLVLGVPFVAAPAWTVLCCWLLFLVGLGVLAYRLGGAWWGAALAIAIASLTHNFLHIFQWTLSEPIFLPLLVWAVVLLVGLPQHDRLPLWQTSAAIVVLALLMMTRYVGVVLFAAVGVWWGWWRVRQGRARRLVWEWPLWGLSALPLAAWMVRNRLVSPAVVGAHTKPTQDSFWDGVGGVLNQMSQILLPALRPMPNVLDTHEGGLDMFMLQRIGLQVAVVGIMLLLARPLWRRYRRRNQPLPLPPSPIVAMVAAYVGLYVAGQPFASFRPMDDRDATTMLCLVQPLLVVVVLALLQQRAGRVFGVYLGLNVLIVLVPLLLSGVPRVVSFTPPTIHDFRERIEAERYREGGIAEWLLVLPFRMRFVQQQHPQLSTFLADVDSPDGVLVTNMNHVLLYDERQEYVPGRVFKMGADYPEILDWMEHGTCESHHRVTLIVLRLQVDEAIFDQFLGDIARKCPGLEPEAVGDVVVYQLQQR